ncbi:MAG: L-seryl-tRNA(Sec) selenium transferase [Armatimonadota bacterium]
MTRRALPSVEKLSRDASLSAFPRLVAIAAAREAVSRLRSTLAECPETATPDPVDLALLLAHQRVSPSLRPAINATGVVLHTNLGRATLAPEAAEAVRRVASGHCTLEVDLETGGRGSRRDHVQGLLRELTGAEAAIVVNNNAAATHLAVAAMAHGREVLLSRGEMVEIGGQFRLPDVVRAAGAVLVEVGATNRTRIADYADVIGPETGMLLRCHTSNYRIVGFHQAATIEELTDLGRDRGVLVGDDLGSGALHDLAPLGIVDEPTVGRSVAAGADLVWFSGDKLLGGPQCGIVVGTRASIDRLARHPLARAARPCKLTLAALEATLRLHRDTNPFETIPVLRRLAEPANSVRQRAERIAADLEGSAEVSVVPTESATGGGAVPGGTLPSWGVALSGGDTVALARRLRSGAPSVHGRIEQDRLLLDMRTVDPGEEELLSEAVRRALDRARG